MKIKGVSFFKVFVFGLLFLTFIFFVFATPSLDFISPTLDNGSYSPGNSVEINVSIVEPNLNLLIYNWNGTNYTLFNSSSLKVFMNFNNLSSLGESSSKIVDLSDGVDNATNSNAVWTSEGRYGGAYNFNTSNYLVVPTQSYLKPPLYFSLWAKRASLNGTGWFLVKYGGGAWGWDGWGFYPTSDNRVAVWLNGNYQDNYFYSTQTFDQEWNHFYVEIRRQGQNRVYLNGNLILDSYDGNTAYNENVDLGIGNSFNGTIDELKIWNKPLSYDEMIEDYMVGLQKFNSSSWNLYVNQSKNFTLGLDNGSYSYQVFASDNLGANGSSELRVVNIGAADESSPIVGLVMLNPLSDVNVSQYEFFNVSVNVSCNGADCGWINVSLDPSNSISQWVANATGNNTYGGSWDYDSMIGVADVPTCSDNSNAWASSGGSSDYAQLNLTYNTSVYATGVNVHETYVAGFMLKIDFEAEDGTIYNVWEGSDSTTCPGWLNVSFSQTAKKGNKLILYTNGSKGHWEEIDAVELVGYNEKGLISMDTSSTPFYTNISNPYNINLSNGGSSVITWWVNASGSANSTHEFFVYANLTSNMSISNVSSSWNVTILSLDLVDPVVSLIYPADNFGSDGNLSFIYNVSDSSLISNCSLILNSVVNQSNSSVVKDINMSFILENLDIGGYLWRINCSDSNGNIGSSEEYSFAVIFDNNFVGNTTNISSQDIENVSLIIDNPSYGNILFLENVNLSSGADINNNVNISYNLISINSSVLSMLNRSARLTLYNLTFDDPQILKDDEICEDCYIEDYDNGSLIFNVTGFSSYSSRETPVVSGVIASNSGSLGKKKILVENSSSWECLNDSGCLEGYSCYNHECVKLFDVEILDVEPFIEGLSFELNYLVKGMADINGDVVIEFWLENDHDFVELGKDTIYLGSFETKNKTTILNLPKDISDDSYNLYVQASFENYEAQSFRKVNTELFYQEPIVQKSVILNVPALIYIFLIVEGFIVLILVLFILEVNKSVKSYLKLRDRVYTPVKVKFRNNVKPHVHKVLHKLKIKKEISSVGDATYLSEMDGKTVFNSLGKKLGKIDKAVIQGSKIYGWVVVSRGKKKVLIKYEDVISIKDIVIVSGELKV